MVLRPIGFSAKITAQSIYGASARDTASARHGHPRDGASAPAHGGTTTLNIMKHHFTLHKYNMDKGDNNTITCTDYTDGPTVTEYLKQGYSIISSTPVK